MKQQLILDFSRPLSSVVDGKKTERMTFTASSDLKEFLTIIAAKMQVYINHSIYPPLEGDQGGGHETDIPCISCNKIFASDEGKYWTVNGYLCVACYDAADRRRLHQEFFDLLAGRPRPLRRRI